jgi:hypothetical protein
MPPVMRLVHRLALLAGLAVGIGLHASPAHAGDDELCERAIRHGATSVGIPEAVLRAIALTETGRWQGGRLRPWPWAVNREGRGHWFASRDEKLAFARASVAANRPSFDMGCFQINYYWHGENFPSLDAMADPETGAVYAARFLRDLYGEFGTWSAAAGAYHSRTPEIAERYRARFDRILAGLGGEAAPPPAAVAEGPREPIPVRRIRGPRIVTIRPDGVIEVASPGREPAERPDEAAPMIPAGGGL